MCKYAGLDCGINNLSWSCSEGTGKPASTGDRIFFIVATSFTVAFPRCSRIRFVAVQML